MNAGWRQRPLRAINSLARRQRGFGKKLPICWCAAERRKKPDVYRPYSGRRFHAMFFDRFDGNRGGRSRARRFRPMAGTFTAGGFRRAATNYRRRSTFIRQKQA